MTNKTYVWGLLSCSKPRVVEMLDPRTVRVSVETRYDPRASAYRIDQRVDVNAKPVVPRDDCSPTGKTVWTWMRDEHEGYGLSIVLDACTTEYAIARWQTIKDRVLRMNSIRDLLVSRPILNHDNVGV